MPSINPKAAIVANRCRDAYSADRYRSWIAVAKVLLACGYDERQAEAIMRSKITRWAADQSGKPYGKVPANAVIQYIASARFGKPTPQYIDEIVRETFNQ